ncbi:MAG: MvaI/BcnI restriction endonuclease family protein [Candidatus Cloacimonetes bacterium]|nr:MvaI/BcnI restriction endonuclease family protein [Candidatus Cloacimonadota bacterium]
MKIFTKENLITNFKEIFEMGWVENKRHGNQGGIGNTLEDLLGIEENNLPIPNSAEWELKAQRSKTTALTTLFHIEPSPRAVKFVPNILLPKYGWSHQKAGDKYSINEMSFRQTINGNNYSNRGFCVKIDRENKKVLISFDHTKVDSRHYNWLNNVKSKAGLDELNPQPYWGFDDLMHKAGTKLLNTFYVQADVKRDKETKKEYYHYNKVFMLQKFSFEGFLKALENANILVDFDARTGHNHGTKFRLRQNHFIDLYEKITRVI